MASVSSRLENGVGFSSGTALLGPYQPPPLVPSCLAATIGATGPSGIFCAFISTLASTGVAVGPACNVDGTPCEVEQHGPQQAQRQHEAHGGAHHVGPVVADVGFAAGCRRRVRARGHRLAAAHERAQRRHHQRQAHHRRDHLQADDAHHLRQVGQLRLAGVVLLVGVGEERHHRVQRQVPAHVGDGVRDSAAAAPCVMNCTHTSRPTTRLLSTNALA